MCFFIFLEKIREDKLSLRRVFTRVDASDNAREKCNLTSVSSWVYHASDTANCARLTYCNLCRRESRYAIFDAPPKVKMKNDVTRAATEMSSLDYCYSQYSNCSRLVNSCARIFFLSRAKRRVLREITNEDNRLRESGRKDD